MKEEQTIAFLIFADHHGCKYELHEKLKPLQMMLCGPGGVGKSQVFSAIGEFYTLLGHELQLKITAPTSLAANNVGSVTIHAEASLHVEYAMHSGSKHGQTCRSNIEEKQLSTTAHISDKIYFLGVLDFAQMSVNLQLAKQAIEEDVVLSNLDTLFAGDPAQLPPLNATFLYDHELVKSHTTTKPNGLNGTHK